MTRFVVSALGSAGDVHPFIAISQGVDRARSYRADDRVAVLRGTHRAGRRRLRADGCARRLRAGRATTRAVAPSRRSALHHRRVAATLAGGLRDHPGRGERAPTPCWSAARSHGARVSCRRSTALPGATVHLSPLCIQSAIAPPVLPGIGDLSWMPAVVAALAATGRRAPRARSLHRQAGLNGFRASLGLSPVERIWSPLDPFGPTSRSARGPHGSRRARRTGRCRRRLRDSRCSTRAVFDSTRR